MNFQDLIQLSTLAELVRANAVHRVEIRAAGDRGFQLVAHIAGQPRALALQRGGIRTFKTLDAAGAFARRDLGIRHLELNLSDMQTTGKR